jgi:hypothetical protein
MNSWDVLTNPGGLLFDISERLQHLNDYPQILLVVITFFLVVTSLYGLLWNGLRVAFTNRTQTPSSRLVN